MCICAIYCGTRHLEINSKKTYNFGHFFYNVFQMIFIIRQYKLHNIRCPSSQCEIESNEKILSITLRLPKTHKYLCTDIPACLRRIKQFRFVSLLQVKVIIVRTISAYCNQRLKDKLFIQCLLSPRYIQLGIYLK